MRAAIAVLTAFVATPAAAIQCLPAAQVIDVLDGLGRQAMMHGTDADGDGLTVYVSPTTREWTIILFPAARKDLACPLGSGIDMMPVLAGVPS